MVNIAVFDMNETTLDLAPVRMVLDDCLGEAGFALWFQKLLQLSMTTTAIDGYVDFSMLARHALDAVATARSVELADDAWDQVARAMGVLDPYPDVVAGLTRLRSAGWSTIALTNSAPDSVQGQLDRTGLTPLFDHILSVDAVKTFKPAAAPYLYAAEVVGAQPSELWMVACHDWDLAGARAVGYRTAYIERPGMAYADTFKPPDLSVIDFEVLADSLLGLTSSGAGK